MRSVILTARHYIRAGLKAWPFVIAGAVLLAGYLVWSALRTPVYYEAKVVFVVNDSQNQSSGGLGSVLGRISLGGATGGGANLKRISAFVTSRQLLNEVMLDSATIDGRADLVANHLIVAGDLVNLYELDSINGTVRISNDSVAMLSRQERSLMKLLYSYLTMSKEQPMTARFEEFTDMFRVVIKTRSEEFSLYLAESIFDKLTRFYTLESTAPARNSVERLQVKADSVLGALNSAEYQFAAFSDTRLSLANRRDQVQSIQLNRKITVLATAYGELIRNLEAAKFSLDATTPYFKLIEAPFTPLTQKRKDPYQAAILGAFLGGLIAFVVAVLIRFYRDIMAGRPVDDPHSL